MITKKNLVRFSIVGCITTLAACASNAPEESFIPVKTPAMVTPAAPVGPAPGSQDDLMQTAGDRVYFGYDQYNLTPGAQAILKQQAAWLQAYPTARIRIAGNCDERGTREYNLALGARRANAARNFLVSQGVDAMRITTISYGKERPINPASHAAAWSENRNATTSIIDGDTGV